MQAISDFVPDTGRAITGCRIGVPSNFFQDGLSPAVAAAFDQALGQAAKLGARLVPVTLPDPEELNTIARIILLSEASAFLEPYLHRRADFGSDVLALLDQGRLVSAIDYVNAQRLRRLFHSRWTTVGEHTDVIFTPTVAFEPPPGGHIDANVRVMATRLVRPFNALGLPAISIPLNTSGFPVGLQIAGRSSDEAKVLSVARALDG
jgi:aspartyl-tRNA(Asn)/glutamyl-tRNA(Gln) amidotransferase subunit A